MSLIRFGDRPADMFDSEWYGFGAYFSPDFPQEDLEPEVSTSETLVFRDPGTGSTLRLDGSFDLSSQQGFWASYVTRLVLGTGANELLMDWSGFKLGLAQMLSYDPVWLAYYLLGGADSITSGAGADALYGRGGGDLIEGAGGDDRILGDEGNDTLVGGDGRDTLSGGADADRLHGDGGDDRLDGDEGLDTLEGGDGNDSLDGGLDDDTIFGGAGGDSISGGAPVSGIPAGNDRLYGEAGKDTLDGGDGTDHVDGGDDDDLAAGGGDDDTLLGAAGDDVLRGDDGADRIDAGSGGDTLDGGDGNDSLEGVDGCDWLEGGQGADSLDGGDGDDTLDGGEGADFLAAGAGNDTLNGGPLGWGVAWLARGESPAISADGRFAAFYSDLPLAGEEYGGVFVADLVDGTMQRVTLGSDPSISGDGRLVAFRGAGIVVKDLETGEFTTASASASGVVDEIASSHSPAISADGRWVAFVSNGAELVPGDTNGFADVFVKDLQTGAIELVSRSAEAQADRESDYPSISADGRYVGFVSFATNLVGSEPISQSCYYVKDRLTGEVTLAAAPAGGPGSSWAPVMSGDGRHVAWNDYVTHEVFVRDLDTGLVASASLDSEGVPSDGITVSISHDGRYVAFSSRSSTLGTAEADGFPTGRYDVFVRDMANGTIEVVTEPADLTGVALDALYPVLSADAGTVVLLAGRMEGTWIAAAKRGATSGDVFDGGPGLDTAHYQGAGSDYEITATVMAFDTPLEVSQRGGLSDAVDRLTSVERLRFDDLGVAFDVTPTGDVDDPVTKGEGGNAGKAYRLYQAAFDRAPDLAGLGYWIAQVDAGERLADIASGFIGSAEFEALYGASPTNQEYTRALYLNVLDREPDAPGYAYWDAMLDGEPYDGVYYGSTTRQQMLVDFSESAENKANVIGVIAEGLDYLPWA